MTKVLVLGTTGMLGAMVHQWLKRDTELEVVGSARAGAGAGLRVLDVEKDGVDLGGIDWVVNCIGVIKPYIHDDNRAEVTRAIYVNSLFPIKLAAAAEASSARVIQIATDCVYSGRTGKYVEGDAHDATDVYGKSKSLGEVTSERFLHLRCSIIGPEKKGFVSLLEWFRRQPKGAALNGYRNHDWNGVTTLHFAKVCQGIIRSGSKISGLQHLVPTGDITKAALLRSFAEHLGRGDVTIKEVDAPSIIDRRLRTQNAERNAALWSDAGHTMPPTVPEMVAELAATAAVLQ
jgi:dTDP-4-dehydrorhamnose reductase